MGITRVKTIIRNNKCLVCVEDYLAPYGLGWTDVKKVLLLDDDNNPPPVQLYYNNWNDYYYSEKIEGYHGESVNHYLIFHLLNIVLSIQTGEKKIDF